jgi:hypothetical protein
MLSVDDSYFRDYAPIVKRAWKKFCGYDVFITHVTDSPKTPFHAKVPLVKNCPSANLAKLARYWMAGAWSPDDIIIIHDMDSAPLQKKYSEYIYNSFCASKCHICTVGKEVYANEKNNLLKGKAPASFMIGYSSAFREVYFSYETFPMAIKTYNQIMAETRNYQGMAEIGPEFFSDESTTMTLLETAKEKGIFVGNIERNYEMHNIIDRNYFHVDQEKLFAGGYIEINFLRPLDVKNRRLMKDVIDYIEK